jgi:hypothetical protein
MKRLHLHQHPATNLKLVRTKGRDKLGVGVTKKVKKYHGTSFPWEARVLVSTGRGRQTEMKDKAAGLGREPVSKSMSVFGRDRRDNLTS